MLKKFKSNQNKAVSDQSSHSATVDRDESTCIGEAISMEGSISGKGNLIIQGNMKGKIDLSDHQFTVGTKGSVEADIQARKVMISGKMKGNVIAREKVEITESGDFEGEIKAKRISVEDGAYMKATIELEKKQVGESTVTAKPTLHKPAATATDSIKADQKK